MLSNGAITALLMAPRATAAEVSLRWMASYCTQGFRFNIPPPKYTRQILSLVASQGLAAFSAHNVVTALRR